MDNIKVFLAFLIFGSIVCFGTLLLTAGNGQVSAVPTATDIIIRDGDNQDASADPFGYFMGEWYLWEYIGDTVSSMFR